MDVKVQLKEKKVLRHLKNNQANIVSIQESHMKGKEAEKFKVGWVGHVFHNSYSSKCNGVIILIHKNINFVLLKQKKDSEGRILCLEAMVEGMVPNTNGTQQE
uniref:Endonuclease/exonuclease/phosphatase domain-containing protein n=1 Tax=Sinocyclocheilus rhinocerous TaxID=307959 RepID=A0A673I8I2_9TELE